MKIINDNGYYIQKSDVQFFNKRNLSIPSSVINKVYSNNFVDDSNKYDFVKLDSTEEINFFESIDWIVNYDDVKDLIEDDFIDLMQEIREEYDSISEKFYYASSEEREFNRDMVIRCEALEYKANFLRDFLWFKQGYIKMELPEGVQYPYQFIEKKGIKKFIKRFFK